MGIGAGGTVTLLGFSGTSFGTVFGSLSDIQALSSGMFGYDAILV